jgi:hypothetical protein
VGNKFRLLTDKLKERKVNPRPSPQRRIELKKLLNSALTSKKSPSVKMIAADVGVSTSCLRYWFPDLCALLSEQHKAAEKISVEAHHAQQSKRVREIVRMIRAEGRYPSQRQVEYVLRKEGMSLVQPYLMQVHKMAVGYLR